MPREDIDGGWSIEPDPDGHLHAYVFIDHTDSKISSVLSDVAKSYRRDAFPRVRWAGSVIGDYRALMHIEVDDPDDLDSLHEFLDEDLWEKGVHCQTAMSLAVINKKGTKKDTPDVLALVAIKTEFGKTMDVAKALAIVDQEMDFAWFNGASILNGQIDILLQLNADSVTQQQERLFLDEGTARILGDIPGIASTSTAIAEGARGPWSGPFPPEWERPRGS